MLDALLRNRRRSALTPLPPSLPAAVASTKLVEVPCNLCGGEDPKLICVDEGYRICRCGRCKLVYVTPQPKLAGGADASFHATSDVAFDPKFREEKTSVYAQGLAELDRLHPARGRLLDVGCGFGLFLDQAAHMGWEVFGIDVSEVSVAYARQELGLDNVERRELTEARFSDGFFQAATLWNLLEHVADPVETLSQVRRILAPNGSVLVRVPNMLVHDSLWRARPLLRPLLGALGSRLPPYLGGISPPHHLYGFTPRTLRATLHRAGFSGVEIHPAVPHGARSALGRAAAAVGHVAYRASGHRMVLSPAVVAYARAEGGGGRTQEPPRGTVPD